MPERRLWMNIRLRKLDTAVGPAERCLTCGLTADPGIGDLLLAPRKSVLLILVVVKSDRNRVTFGLSLWDGVWVCGWDRQSRSSKDASQLEESSERLHFELGMEVEILVIRGRFRVLVLIAWASEWWWSRSKWMDGGQFYIYQIPLSAIWSSSQPQ